MALLKQARQVDLRFGIRHGFDMDAFCEKYSCTPEEFVQHVRLVYRHDHEAILDAVRANGKRLNRFNRGDRGNKCTPPRAISEKASSPHYLQKYSRPLLIMITPTLLDYSCWKLRNTSKAMKSSL